MNPTPRQVAEELYATIPPQERFAQLQADMAYLEALDAEQAPVFTIHAEPDNPLAVPIMLTVTGAEFLIEFKALVLGRLEKTSREAAAAIQQADIPADCPTSQLEVGPGLTVTIVHSGPPIARSEAEVTLD